MNRLRQQIVDLDTGKVYINESMAASDTKISRYHIHKSLKDMIKCKGKMFAYFSYGSDVAQLREQYLWNSEKMKT